MLEALVINVNVQNMMLLNNDLQNNGYFVEKWDVYHNNQKIDEAKSSSFKVLADNYAKIFVV